MPPILEVRSVSKIFRTGLGGERIPALREVSLEVGEGEIFALLGLNGAGKSTLIRIILDLVRPTSGEVLLFGEPVRHRRGLTSVGYLPELFAAPKGMSARRVLTVLGQLSGLGKEECAGATDAVLANVELAGAAQRKAERYSKGMMLRLGIAQALLHKPRIVFLDEPTEGLDPLGRKMIRDLLRRLSSEGVTVFLNSHLLSEVELVADRIAILQNGRIVLSGILKEILPRGPAEGTGSTLEELFFAFLNNRHDDQHHRPAHDS